MNSVFSRRAWLKGTGHAAIAGALAASLPRGARGADDPAKASICLAMVYPAGEGLKFDADGFRDHHMAVLKGAYGDALERVELRVTVPPGEGAPPPPLLAAVSIWIRDVSKFIAAANAHSKEVSADIANLTNSAPMVQFDKVIAGLGGERGTVSLDSKCYSLFFPVKEGATWDSKSFAEVYLPKVYAAYGAKAIQRIEAAEGAAGQGGAKPLLLGAAHIYVGDEAAYGEAGGSDAVKQLAGEEVKYYSAPPFPSVMQVHAVG